MDKCCVLGIGRLRLPVAAPTDFYIDGHKLSLVSFCRDLGVTVSHDLKAVLNVFFSLHHLNCLYLMIILFDVAGFIYFF